MNQRPDNQSDWYYSLEGQLIGPFSKLELQKQVDIGSITPDTLIKKSTDAEYIRAETVTGLFSETMRNDSHKKTNTSAKAADILSNIHKRGFTQTTNEEETSESFFSKLSLSNFRVNTSRLTDTFETVTDFLSEKLSIFGYLFKLWILIPLMLLIAIGLFLNFFATDWYYRSIAYETYSEIWNDFKTLREQKPDDQQWDEFEKEVRSKIVRINLSIERSATVDDPYAMELLRAGRDYLPKMLNDARDAPSRSEKQYALHMQKAKQFARQTKSPFQNIKMMYVLGFLFVVFDSCLIGWGLIFLFRKFRY